MNNIACTKVGFGKLVNSKIFYQKKIFNCIAHVMYYAGKEEMKIRETV